MDLTQFVTGSADRRALRRPGDDDPRRRRPVGEVETFASAGGRRAGGRADVHRGPRAHPRPLRERRARRSSSRRSRAGRKNSCASRSTARRARSHGTPSATRSSGSASATSRTTSSAKRRADARRRRGSHARSRPPTPRASRHVPRALPRRVRGRRRGRAIRRSPTTRPSRDGHAQNVLCDAIALEPRTAPARRRVDVMKLGLLTAAFPRRSARAGRRVGCERGLRDDRGRVLADRRRRAPPLRGTSHIDVERLDPAPSATCSTGTGSRSPRSPTTRTTCIPTPPSGAPRTRTCAR